MSTKFKGFAASAAGKPLASFVFDPGPLRPDQVEVIRDGVAASPP